MKKIIVFFLFFVSVATLNAQMRFGFLKSNDNEGCMYYNNNRGTYTYYTRAAEDMTDGPYTCSKNKIKFSGYFVGEIRDPRDNYVNIRKGPGTNYSVVGKVYVKDLILYQQTNTNWLKVYSCNWGSYFNPQEQHMKYELVGYIYKDRVIFPKHLDVFINPLFDLLQ